MKTFNYKTKGTCSREISFTLTDSGKVENISFVGGCNGNLKGISALCEGQDALAVISRLEGIKCGMKDTSCPDQLSKALKEALGK
ncbi:MAG TPA: TIGR03905 family TSCPD domain-containing protein [Candidatus Ornithospirochaeta avicola]|uniref:ribonucleoside-diphosphate reductase n=1 Tax=Candidatus Ornithospirochaeta avicola TaxID=2840896 RepID=A0A9D1PRX6_9SPIO|nr:TIGR03905 family TSCPD domain-containing protein [Candidatus Ornithospirochaeta avicola]